MTELRREDVATPAAHRQLGSRHDDAIAEGLVQRISAEIDRVVECRLEQRSPAVPDQPARPSRTMITLSLGSVGMGVAGAAVVLGLGSHLGHGYQVALIALMWVIIGIVNVAHSRKG
ncbi:MAG TPA: hypothetical protein VGI64_23700 [Streptosporangiaceae bacterium]|jgi:hypothetical protein